MGTATGDYARTWDGEPISSKPPYGAMVVVYRWASPEPEFLILHRGLLGPDFLGEWAGGPPLPWRGNRAVCGAGIARGDRPRSSPRPNRHRAGESPRGRSLAAVGQQRAPHRRGERGAASDGDARGVIVPVFLPGQTTYLRALEPEDTEHSQGWFANREVTRYSLSAWLFPQSAPQMMMGTQWLTAKERWAPRGQPGVRFELLLGLIGAYAREWDLGTRIGGASMVLAPPALQSSPSPVPVATLLFAFGWMLLVALLLASGWVLVHGGPRPQQSAWRVVLLAVLLYVLVGLAWELVYVLTNPYGDRPHPGFLLFALIWPWHVAFVFGLFGLGPQ